MDGERESDWLKRVASQWATNGYEYDRFYAMMASRRALPNTPALANAGKAHPMGSACFVLPVPDDTEGILDTLRAATFVHKYGGGTGFDFSPVRSRTATVSSTGRAAPGPVEGPLKGYSEWLGRWSQAGLRSGANMGMLSVYHPDIRDFITAKRGTESVLTNFNISVKVTDEFMTHLEEPGRWEIWRELVQGAWENGEPGIFFEDTVNNARLHPEKIHATNPCGEVPLLPYEACVLGSVNLAAFVSNGAFDWDGYRETVDTLTVLLDNIIELQHYPLPEIERGQKRYRKVGVGVMGYADALVDLGVRYGSEAALEFAHLTGRALQEQSYETSEFLGHDRGYFDGFQLGQPRRRNLNCQVIAPTGTISRLAECSFGIEPHFDVNARGEYESFVVGGQFTDHQPRYQALDFTPASMVSLDQHVDTQAAWQRHIDQAVSKTINCPHETTPDEISDAMIRAWDKGCKGMTVLRDASRKDVVIGTADCVGAACAI